MLFLETRCKSMATAIDTAKRVAANDIDALIVGESGVGKEVLADYIRSISRRSAQPYVKINCSAIPPSLADSELFGHKKGTFTGALLEHTGKIEHADGGIIVFDEIGDIPDYLQMKLLRVLDKRPFCRLGDNVERSVDVRMFFLTNKNLRRLVDDGEIRDDFFHRINVMSIRIPPLRERAADILPVAETIKDQHQRSIGKRADFSKRSLAFMSSYAWPGNVRELDRRILIGLINAGNGKIEMDAGEGGDAGAESKLPTLVLDDLIQTALNSALRSTNYVQKNAAEVMGISVRRMNYMIKKYGVKHESWTVNKKK